MAQEAPRWLEITPSQFPHEAEGLARIRTLLPDTAPFRAWSNFEFRDGHGKRHEVELLVFGRQWLHLAEPVRRAARSPSVSPSSPRGAKPHRPVALRRKLDRPHDPEDV